MAFNLQKVLRALLFSSSQPLSIKDVQDIFTRFHEQAPAVAESDEETPPAPAETDADAAPDAGQPAGIAQAEQQEEPPRIEQSEQSDQSDLPAASEIPSETSPEPAAEIPAEEPAPELTADDELYNDVPSLVTAAQIREAMDAIASEMRATGDIYLLIEGPAGYRIVTHPRYARWIRIMRDEPPPVKLSQSALETLAIVAYRQPVTRTEIETIRGVSAEAGLNKLLEREMVRIIGRAELPGRPLQYGTTEKFMEFVGVKSLVELPASDVLSPRQIDAWLQSAANVTPPADAEMGLPLEEGEGATPNLASVTIDHSTTPAGLQTATAPDEPSAQPPAATDPDPAEQTAPDARADTSAAPAESADDAGPSPDVSPDAGPGPDSEKNS